jgi:hypothetical protein
MRRALKTIGLATVAFWAIGVVLLIALLPLVGCTTGGETYRAMIAASDTAANHTIGPEYLRYVEADDSLSMESKLIRVQGVSEWRRAVTAAQMEAR